MVHAQDTPARRQPARRQYDDIPAASAYAPLVSKSGTILALRRRDQFKTPGGREMNRSIKIGILLSSFVLFVVLSVPTSGQKQRDNGSGIGLDELKRIQRGFEIAPVTLDFRNKDRNLVGLGSYIV